MHELVKVSEYQIGTKKTQGVNARDLWNALGVKTDFNTWIKRRLKKTGFVENQDYSIFPTFGEKSEKGRPTLEYILGMDLSKHVAMLEGGDIGREVRQYFIECEKKAFGEPASQVAPSTDPLIQQAEMFLAFAKRQSQIEAQVVENQTNANEAKQIAQEAKQVAEHIQEVTRTDNGFMPIVAYARKIKAYLNTERSKNIGFALSKYCKQNGIETHKIDHPYYPTGVNTYPVEVLQKHNYLFV